MTSFDFQSHHLVITVESPIFEASGADSLGTGFERYLSEAIESVHIDLRRVESIDSSGVDALVSLKERLRRQRGECPMALRNPGPKVMSVINLLGLDRIFQVETV